MFALKRHAPSPATTPPHRALRERAAVRAAMEGANAEADASASAFIPAPGPALATAPAAVPTADAAAQMRQEISDLMVATAVAQPMAARTASPKSSGGKELVAKTPRWVLTEEAKAVVGQPGTRIKLQTLAFNMHGGVLVGKRVASKPQ